MENGQAAGGELMQCVKVGKLNLVDLAGSERVHITGATGELPPWIDVELCLPVIMSALTHRLTGAAGRPPLCTGVPARPLRLACKPGGR